MTSQGEMAIADTAGAVRRRGPFWMYLFTIAAGTLGLIYVYSFGVNVPWLDQWEVVTLLDKHSSGSLQLADLLRQHNEHRTLFPNTAMLILALVTGYNTVAEMYLIALVFLLTALVMTSCYWDETVQPQDLAFFCFIPLLIFSFKQFGNTLWGFQITFAFVQLFAVLAFYFLGRLASRSDRRGVFLAAVSSGGVASFSSIHGLIVWPVGLIQILLLPLTKSRKKGHAILWTCLGLFSWISYFLDYAKPAGHPSLLVFLRNPLRAVTFFFTLLGESLCWNTGTAFVAGIFLAGAFLVSILLLSRAHLLHRSAFWTAVTLFSLMVLASITIGRVGFGPDFAQASRYVTFSLLAVVGIHALTTRALSAVHNVLSHSITVAFRILLCVTLPLGYYLGWQAGAEVRRDRTAMAHVLLHYRDASDDQLQSLYPSTADEVKRRARILERLGFSVFAGKAPE